MLLALMILAASPASQPTGELFATLHTSLGDVVVKLYERDAPKTVANFVGLAQGTQVWTDAKTKQGTTRPLYQNVLCHRIIIDFMFQCGDPTGTGMGGPGYELKDEIGLNLRFDRPGVLAMANHGPNTAGSQFFITTKEQPALDGKYTIFGQVVKGMSRAMQIGRAATGPGDRPLEDVVIRAIDINRQ
jgi:peptidyl-prolyl cis-trans isomerase A (cyclophilin A)